MAGRTTSQLVVELLDRVSGPARRIGAALGGMNRKIDDATSYRAGMRERLDAAIYRNNNALQSARAGILDAVGAYYTLKAAIGGPVQAAAEFESAMADVKKVVDFPTPEAFKEFRKELFALSKEIPISVDGLAQIAAAAGQAGIAGDDLLRFTEVAAKVGTAFDISADEAGDALAKLMTGMGMSIDEVVHLSDAMNHLSNKQASTAAEILDVMKRVGAQSKQFGFSAEQTAAFASAMIASGAESEVAATSFRNMGKALTRGESATKRQSAAFDRLGLDAAEVAQRMQEDAVGTTVDVLERISKLPKETQAAISSDLFGDEARALGPLLTNLDLVRSSLGYVAAESDYAGSAFKEFETRNATFGAKLQRFNNTLYQLKVTIGDALLPVLTQLIDATAPIIEKIAGWVDAHQELTGHILTGVAALVAFKAAINVLRLPWLIGKAGVLMTLSAGLRLVTADFGAATVAAEGFAAATGGAAAAKGSRFSRLLPLLGRLAKTGGVAAGVYYGLGIGPANEAENQTLPEIERRTEALTPAEQQALADAETARANAGITKAPLESTAGRIARLKEEAEDLRQHIAGIQSEIENIGDGPMTEVLAGPLQEQLQARQDDLAAVEEELEAVVETARLAGTAIGGLDGLTVAPQIDTKSLDSALEKTERMRGLLLSMHGQAAAPAAGPPAPSKPDGARAKGGPVSAGKTYLVGEKGPEPITPTRSGYVHPTGSGGGISLGGVTVNMTNHFGEAPKNAAQFAQDVSSRMERALGDALRGVMADLQMEM